MPPFPPAAPFAPALGGALWDDDDSESKNDFCGLYAAFSFSASFSSSPPAGASSAPASFWPVADADRGVNADLSNFALLLSKSKSVTGTLICGAPLPRPPPRRPPRPPPPVWLLLFETRRSPKARSTVSRDAAAVCTGLLRRPGRLGRGWVLGEGECAAGTPLATG